MEQYIIPVILAGGVGTRLWPVSRESHPKQFCKFVGDHSLLQETAIRAINITDAPDLIVVTNNDYYFLCQSHLDEIGLTNVHYILEPCSRNTAPAIALAAHYASKNFGAISTLLILPADHYLENSASLKAAVESATYFSQQNKLIVFGIHPIGPKTGYGYIEQGASLAGQAYEVKRFIEKPSEEKARDYLQQGGFFWNSGMFLFQVTAYLTELKLLAKPIYDTVTSAFLATKPTLGLLQVDASFSASPNQSIDYGVMEKTNHAVVLPLDTGWSDLGCWSSIAELDKGDEENNVIQGNVIAKDTNNCLLSSEGRHLIALGIKNQVIVNTSDATLVIDKSLSQEVKAIVKSLKEKDDLVAIQHQRIYRPWGYYETLFSAPGFQVKFLSVEPGASLSLQLHHFRSEHWVVVSGKAKVINGDQQLCLSTGESTYIMKNVIHRLSNPEKKPLCVIEVQCGSYLGEDDIERFDDIYGRGKLMEQPQEF